MHPQVEPPSPRPYDAGDRRPNILNRIATLFVSQGGTDVAITTQSGPRGASVAVARMDEEQLLSVTKSSLKRREQIYRSERHLVAMF